MLLQENRSEQSHIKVLSSDYNFFHHKIIIIIGFVTLGDYIIFSN